jgi:hypothetical protein
MTSANTFRKAAAEALTNANELCAEAELLAKMVIIQGQQHWLS